MEDAARQAAGKLGEYAYAESRGRNAAEVLKDIVENVQEIIRAEVRLAKAETREEAAKAWRAARLLLMGAVLGFFALGFVLTTVALLLALAMPAWVAAGLTALAVGITAVSLIAAGRKRLKTVNTKPEKTIESVKENVEWMKGQTRS